jgi:serine/threonine protein kinase
MQLLGLQIGPYKLQQLLGRGGMGEVYLAEDLKLTRQVALKVIQIDVLLGTNPAEIQKALQLFQREAQAIAQLHHPYILSLYGYGEQIVQKITLPYMVMPFCKEGSLNTWLRQRSPLTLETAIDLLLQAADALQYAHDQQIIHRDVKPANFLLRTRRNRQLPDLLLADFGIAALMSGTTNLSLVERGTPAYMAPEQWNALPTYATDQYALGVMAYQLLTGRTPFLGDQYQLMYQHLNVEPQPPSTHNPAIPQDIDLVILKALAKKPQDRFPSILAFAQAFQQAIQFMRQPTIVAVSPSQQPTLFAPNQQGGSSVCPTCGHRNRPGANFCQKDGTDLTPSVMNLSGQKFDHYLLLSLLGYGTFGHVYLADDTQNHQQTAVKVLYKHPSKEEEVSFMKEIGKRSLEHPNIIPILDFGIEPKSHVPYIGMSYASEGNIQQQHPKGTQLPIPLVISYVEQLAEVLQFAHSQGLIHGNIKPKNLLLGPEKKILLTDFASDSIFKDQSLKTAIQSKDADALLYIAPEQFQGKVDSASDQYAIGCMVFEWLSGTPPFLGTRDELQKLHLQALPPALPDTDPLLSSGIKHVISKTLNKDPNARFSTLQEFSLALKAEYEKEAVAWSNKTRSFRYPKRPAFAAPEQIFDNLKYASLEEKVEIYSIYLVWVPTDVESYKQRAELYFKLSKDEMALADCNRVVGLDSKSIYAYAYRGYMYAHLGKYEKGLNDLSYAMSLAPNNAGLYCDRGRIHFLSGDQRKALDDFDFGLKLDPTNIKIHRTRDELLKKG